MDSWKTVLGNVIRKLHAKFHRASLIEKCFKIVSKPTQSPIREVHDPRGGGAEEPVLKQDRLTLAWELRNRGIFPLWWHEMGEYFRYNGREYFRYDGREYLRCEGIEYEDIPSVKIHAILMSAKRCCDGQPSFLGRFLLQFYTSCSKLVSSASTNSSLALFLNNSATQVGNILFRRLHYN